VQRGSDDCQPLCPGVGFSSRLRDHINLSLTRTPHFPARQDA
jgi:hypothetical protein